MKIPRVDRMTLGGGGAALLLTLLFGSQTFGLWLTSRAGYLVVPSTLGVPLTLPGLHVTEIGALGWAWTLWETAAALLLVALTAVRLCVRASRQPGTVRLVLTGWWAFALAAAVAGAFRGAVTASFAYAGPGGYLTYALFGALFGLLWGLAFGWLVGLAASAGSRVHALRPAS